MTTTTQCQCQCQCFAPKRTPIGAKFMFVSAFGYSDVSSINTIVPWLWSMRRVFLSFFTAKPPPRELVFSSPYFLVWSSAIGFFCLWMLRFNVFLPCFPVWSPTADISFFLEQFLLFQHFDLFGELTLTKLPWQIIFSVEFVSYPFPSCVSFRPLQIWARIRKHLAVRKGSEPRRSPLRLVFFSIFCFIVEKNPTKLPWQTIFPIEFSTIIHFLHSAFYSDFAGKLAQHTKVLYVKPLYWRRDESNLRCAKFYLGTCVIFAKIDYLLFSSNGYVRSEFSVDFSENLASPLFRFCWSDFVSIFGFSVFFINVIYLIEVSVSLLFEPQQQHWFGLVIKYRCVVVVPLLLLEPPQPLLRDQESLAHHHLTFPFKSVHICLALKKKFGANQTIWSRKIVILTKCNGDFEQKRVSDIASSKILKNHGYLL